MAIESAAGPRDTAGRVTVSNTALGSARSALLEHAHDGCLCARNEDGGLAHPARQTSLEGGLIGGAGLAGLALLFEHDARLEESGGGRLDKAMHVLLPDSVFGKIIHVRGAVEITGDVVGPLVVVHLGAVGAFVIRCAVVHVVVVADESDTPRPIPDLSGPVGERLVSRVAG